MRAEQITGAEPEHGEGPVWWPGWGGLCFVDMLAGDVLRLGEDGGLERWHVGRVAAALRPRRQGGPVVATERGFALAEGYGAEPVEMSSVFDDPTIRFNDGGCDPDGRFWCGTMAYDEATGRGTMYRLDADLAVVEAFDGVTISNGLAWTAYGSRAYYDDTPTGHVDVFDYDRERGLHDRRHLCAVPEDSGHPDGLTVDAEGGVWVALFDGGAVHRYSPEGELTEVVELPVAKVTACTFGGPDLSRLFVTTSRTGETAPHPAAGALFAVDPGVAGLPAGTFTG